MNEKGSKSGLSGLSLIVVSYGSDNRCASVVGICLRDTGLCFNKGDVTTSCL
jgi:hypothetical protein